MRVAVEECSCGLALEDREGQAYNEEAFRHFLAIERKRSERASRSFMLLLVRLRKQPGGSATFTSGVAARVFSGLALCVREVDFVGWYRAERVAAAVLIQGVGTPEPDASRRIGERVTEILDKHLSPHVAERLHVRVLQLCQRPKS